MTNSETRQTKKFVRQTDPITRFDISSTHYGSTCFMQNKVIYFRELAPKQSLHMNVDLYVRSEPTLKPLFNHFDLRMCAFFVPYKMIWTQFAEFITQSLRDGNRVTMVPLLSTHDLATVIITWLTTYYPNCIATVTNRPSSGTYDYIWRSAATSYKCISLLRPEVRAVFDNLQILGYRLSAYIDLTSTAHNTIMSALPLICWTKVWYDFFRVADRGSSPFEPDKVAGGSYMTNAQLSAIINRMAVLPIAFGKSYFAHLETPDEAGNTNLSGSDLTFNAMRSDSQIQNVAGKQFPEQNYFADRDYGVRPWDNSDSTISSLNQGAGNTNPTLRAKSTIAVSEAGDTETNGITQRALFQLSRLTDYVKRVSIAGFSSVKRMLAEYGIQVDDTNVQKTAIFISDYVMKLNADGVTCQDSTNLGAQTCANMNGGGNYNLNYTAKEHGAFLIYLNIRPKVEFVFGRDRFTSMHMKPFDFWCPSFDGYGYQATRVDELHVERDPYNSSWATYQDNNSKTIQGYLPTYAEYKVGQSHATGNFNRYSMRNTYDPYHTARIFNPDSSNPFISGDLLNRVSGEILPERCWSTLEYDIFNLHIDFNAYIDAPMRPLFDLPGEWCSSGPAGHMNGDEVSHM